ncbi:MAG TPA: hypothetical protein VFO01_12625 [Trebonia sp.]|nr:hypothetical protein [Trebonia sp.]
MGYFTAMLGPDVTARLVSGDPVSPAEMRRGYIRAGRAQQSAAPDQEPRIPETTHVIRAEEFTRGPLTARHERPSPASVRPPRLAG